MRVIKSKGHLIKIGLYCGLLTAISACSELNFSDPASAEERDQKSSFITLSPDAIRPPLDTDVSEEALSIPGSVRALAQAPNLAEIEKQLFTSTKTNEFSATTYSLTFSQLELDILNQTGARTVSPAIRQTLSPLQRKNDPQQPINYSVEIQRLTQRGIRTSSR